MRENERASSSSSDQISQSVNVSFSGQPFIYPSLSRKCSGISRNRFNFRIPSFRIEITCRFSTSDDSAEASTTGTLIKHLSSLLKWTMPSPKPSQTDENAVWFEKGYLVETVVERGNKLGVEPYLIRVSPEGELFAVDSVNSNIVRITPPLSQ